MTTLELANVRTAWEGRNIGPFTASYDASRLLLFGDWTWLRASLCGARPLSEGTIRCWGEEARAAVSAGRVGVSFDGVEPPPRWPLGEWLTLSLELLGESSRAARRRARQTLSELGLSTLAARSVAEMNPAETFAAHGAFAAVTSPQLVVLGAPVLLPQTREFELQVISKLADRCAVALACSRRDAWLWEFADEYAYAGSGSRTRLPVELMAEEGRCFRVRTLGDPSGWVAQLELLGALPEGPRDGGDWLVRVPEGGSADLLVSAALNSGVALAELVSVPEAR
jgi:hypothetical protein